MKIVILIILKIIIISKGEWSYTADEMEVIKQLGLSLGINSYTFIQNHYNVESVEKIRNLPENQLFATIVSSEKFYEIITGIERKRFFEKRMILVTKDNLNFTQFIKKLSGIHSVHWLFFVSSLNAIQNQYIPINSNFYIAQNTTTTIVINKAFHIQKGLNVLIKKLGTWSEEKGENKFSISKDKKVNFQKNTLSLLHLFTKKECQSRNMTHVLNKIECFHQTIVEIIAEKLNFTINKVECQEKKYPYNYPNGSASEMFTTLYKREVDLSSGSFIINNHRLSQFDFAWPAFTTQSMMYLRFKSTKSSWRAYLRPMESRVWKAILTWIFTTGIMVKAFEELRLGNFQFRLSLIPELIYSILVSLQVICNQGLHNMSQWYSSRLIFLLTFFLFVSFYQAYSGFLISSLTIAVPDLPFTDIHEFFEDGSYKMMTLKTGFHYYYVNKIFRENNKDPQDYKLSVDELPEETKQGIKKLCTRRKLVYVEYRENMVQNEIPCRVTELHKPLLYQNTGLGFPKNSPYKEIINKQLNILRSSGILHRMKEYLLSYVKLHEKETAYTGYINVSFRHLVSIFFILGMGNVVAVLIFLLEILWSFLTDYKRLKGIIKRQKNNKLKVEIRKKRNKVVIAKNTFNTFLNGEYCKNYKNYKAHSIIFYQ